MIFNWLRKIFQKPKFKVGDKFRVPTGYLFGAKIYTIKFIVDDKLDKKFIGYIYGVKESNEIFLEDEIAKYLN